MAHIVCITGGLTGIFNASLALVQQLEQAGHRITYASSYDLEAAVTAQGINYVQLDPWVIQTVDPPMSRWQKLWTWRERQQRAIAALGIDNFGPAIRQLEPDLVLIDIEMTPHIIAAVTHQLPIALLCPFLSLWKRPNLPPINTNIVPGKTWRGKRLSIRLSWLRNGLRGWKSSQQSRWGLLGIDRKSIWRCYARQVRYPFPEQFGFKQWLIPFNQGNLPIVCFNALELDFPHIPHPLMHYVGPMVRDDRQDIQVHPPIEQRLAQCLAQRRAHGRSLIYCGCSTFVNGHQAWLKRVIAAVGDAPEWDLIIGLGGQMKQEQLGRIPANVHVFDWAPQMEVLKQADCAVINGGINTINECISLGIPMLIYSMGHADQNGNAVRIGYHRLGIVGNRDQDSMGQIRTAIQTLLTDTVYRTNVQQMRDRFQAYSQANRSAQVIATLLKAKRAHP
ncbi:hypothetical protein IQ266_03635 [filamentous cyanobacterium LEGE 11480]|uniref:Erythromycin biosynthesis protein CIII-like C-terminal domain-containing protein n=1 Tax=Romeriopsis navalis LEGE 11480 TaxID=2777977 RepID=A0A928VM24_9CYAN|nr:nucleotide disphospho-sugar-binding domain-containing protein [Romeriopsis navalis]MBE9028852.1 hypothetical protein [Romeriopsis navalis LEGE 11480]